MSEQLPLGLRLNAASQFDNFVAGDNAELVDVLQRVASAGGETSVYCWADKGLGKTHLLQAACRRAAAARRRSAYLALRQLDGITPGVLEGWERYDLVCLDDLQAIAGDARWEEALFHLYNRLRERGASLVASGADAPGNMGLELPDLVSRLEAGLVYPLRSLDDRQRRRALQLRAAQQGVELSDETAEYLLVRVARDMSALCGMLERLDKASLAAQRRLTIPFVKSVLGL